MTRPLIHCIPKSSARRSLYELYSDLVHKEMKGGNK